ncbi:MAG: LytR C-terminal domain-containing protein [Actinobacteria bacterium]|nr:LytR C-terminal domain-containing protein [Actinomycetota bacterium]
MEHSLPHLELVRPWRRATMVASAVAALELVLLLVAGLALLGKPVAERVQTEATRQVLAPVKPKPRRLASAGVAKPLLPRDETSVLVLNGNGRRGAAAEAAARVHGAGYVVGNVGNAERSDYGRSVVMYRPGFRREAARLARDVRVAIVSPLDGLRPQQLLGAHVALVVGV